MSRNAPGAAASRGAASEDASSGGPADRAKSSERQDGTLQKTIAEELALTPADWIRRIVELRRSGRHAEADASLRRFVERYPTFRVPDEARAP